DGQNYGLHSTDSADESSQLVSFEFEPEGFESSNDESSNDTSSQDELASENGMAAVTQSSKNIGFTQRESSAEEFEHDEDDKEAENCASFPFEASTDNRRFLPENWTQDEEEMYDVTAKAEAAYTPSKGISAKTEKSIDSASLFPPNTHTSNLKKRKHSSVENGTSNSAKKVRIKKQDAKPSITLTQMGFGEKNEAILDPARQVRKNELTNDHECTVNRRMFKSGEVFLSKNEDHAGFAFTLGKFYWKRLHIMVEIRCVWLRMEETFIAEVSSGVADEWVLVEDHPILPKNGKWSLPVKNLAGQSEDNFPDEATALRYRVDSRMKYAYSYYRHYGNCRNANPMRAQPRSMDLFAGCGGASIGFEAVGFDVGVKVDSNKVACDTLLINFPNANVFCEDIRNFIASSVREEPGYPKKGDFDHIHGSPPCQGYCDVSTRRGKNDDQNNECTFEFLRAIEHFEPTFVSMENVPGMAHGEKVCYLKKFLNGLMKLSYQVKRFQCSSGEYGDPQDRQRIIVFAAKNGYTLPSIPEQTHGHELGPMVSSGEAIGDLQFITPVPGFGRVTLDNGKRIIWDHSDVGTHFRTKNDDDYLLQEHLPANTIRKTNDIKH
ncbi:hypothetical protein ACHAXS_005515, partial [Conticribra weissflogii]